MNRSPNLVTAILLPMITSMAVYIVLFSYQITHDLPSSKNGYSSNKDYLDPIECKKIIGNAVAINQLKLKSLNQSLLLHSKLPPISPEPGK